jgi:hypothetical protein
LRRVIHIIFLIALTALTGCEKKLPLPEVKTERKIVLIGELIANDSIYIRAGQSVPVTSQNLKFEVANGLSIDIEESSKKYTLNGAADSLSPYLHTVPFVSSNKISAGATYTVTANHADMGQAKVKVTVPNPVKATIQDTATELYATDTTLRVRVNITDVPGENYYVVEALKQLAKIKVQFLHKGVWLDRDLNIHIYDSLGLAGVQLQIRTDTVYTSSYVRHGIYTKDELVENAKDGNQYTLNNRILLTDKTFSSGVYNLEIFVQKRVDLSDGQEYKGQTILLVKSVSPEYFQYLKSYEQRIRPTGYDSSTLPDKIKGNVENGFGIVGGVYQLKFYFQFDSYE